MHAAHARMPKVVEALLAAPASAGVEKDKASDEGVTALIAAAMKVPYVLVVAVCVWWGGGWGWGLECERSSCDRVCARVVCARTGGERGVSSAATLFASGWDCFRLVWFLCL